MEAYFIIVIIFGIIILLLLGLLFYVNRLTLLKLDIENSFSSVKDYAAERMEIFDRIVSFLEKKHSEEGVFIDKIRQISQSLKDIKSANGIAVINESERIFLQFQRLDELYHELKKNKEYLQLKDDYKDNNDRIEYAFVEYDKAVRKYDSYRENAIVDKISKLLHFPEYDYYDNSL